MNNHLVENTLLATSDSENLYMFVLNDDAHHLEQIHWGVQGMCKYQANLLIRFLKYL